MAYIRSNKPKPEGCVFCNKISGEDDTEQIVARSTHVYVTLNLYPYNTGHLMVIPYKHVASQEDMPTEALTDLMLTTNQSISALRKVFNPPGFNLGANLGSAAGAGIAEHFHLHIVPRWPADANFISTVGETRVIPDMLENTYRDLKQAWAELYG